MADQLDDALLAAVRDEVLAYGVRRATAASIAARAGVSRVTLYRRVGPGATVRTLILDALSTEFERVLLTAAAESADAGDTRARLVATAQRAVRALGEAPLVHALLQHDPELLLPYLVDRLGRSQRAALTVFAVQLTEGITDGSVRPLDVDVASTVLLHLLTPFVISAAVVREGADEAAVHAELGRLLDAYLRPEGR